MMDKLSLASIILFVIGTLSVPFLNGYSVNNGCYNKRNGYTYRDPEDSFGFFICKSDFVSYKKCDVGYELNEINHKCEREPRKSNYLLIRSRRESGSSVDVENDSSISTAPPSSSTSSGSVNNEQSSAATEANSSSGSSDSMITTSKAIATPATSTGDGDSSSSTDKSSSLKPNEHTSAATEANSSAGSSDSTITTSKAPATPATSTGDGDSSSSTDISSTSKPNEHTSIATEANSSAGSSDSTITTSKAPATPATSTGDGDSSSSTDTPSSSKPNEHTSTATEANSSSGSSDSTITTSEAPATPPTSTGGGDSSSSAGVSSSLSTTEPTPTINQSTTSSSANSGPTSASGLPCPQEPFKLDCINKPTGTIAADPFDCSKYHYCRKDITYTKNCKDDLLFDPDSKRCVSHELVKCPYYGCAPSPSYTTTARNPTSTVEVTTATTKTVGPTSASGLPCPQEPFKLDCINKPTGTIAADPFDCSKYHYCRKDITYTKNCKDDLLFDPDNKRCVSPELVKCPYHGCDPDIITTTLTPTSTTTKTTTTTKTSTKTTTTASPNHCPPKKPDCSKLETGTALADPTDCNKFYVCRNGEAIYFECPTGFWFDNSTYLCNYPVLVKCPHHGCKN